MAHLWGLINTQCLATLGSRPGVAVSVVLCLDNLKSYSPVYGFGKISANIDSKSQLCFETAITKAAGGQINADLGTRALLGNRLVQYMTEHWDVLPRYVGDLTVHNYGDYPLTAGPGWQHVYRSVPTSTVQWRRVGGTGPIVFSTVRSAISDATGVGTEKLVQVLLNDRFDGPQLLLTGAPECVVYLLLHDDRVPTEYPLSVQTTTELLKPVRHMDVHVVSR